MSTNARSDDGTALKADDGTAPSTVQTDADDQTRRNNWPPFPFSKQTNRTWREQALTRAAELRTLLEWFRATQSRSLRTQPSQLDEAIEGHLQEATTTAEKLSRWRPAHNVAAMERVMSNLDAAEVGLLRRAPKEYVCGHIDHILAHVRFHLAKNDPRRARVEGLAKEVAQGNLDDYGKEAIVQAIWVASLEARREVARVQSFCAVLYATALFLTIAATGLAVWGWVEPLHVPLCFRPRDVDVCPTGSTPSPVDVLLVEFVGLLSGAVSGAAGLRHLNGRTTRLGLPVALTVLKLPTGALTAVLGLLLMRGNFIPGLSNLDTSAQIVAWAVVFGAAQQLVTGFVDRRADDVLSQVAGKTNKEIQ